MVLNWPLWQSIEKAAFIDRFLGVIIYFSWNNHPRQLLTTSIIITTLQGLHIDFYLPGVDTWLLSIIFSDFDIYNISIYTSYCSWIMQTACNSAIILSEDVLSQWEPVISSSINLMSRPHHSRYLCRLRALRQSLHTCLSGQWGSLS